MSAKSVGRGSPRTDLVTADHGVAGSWSAVLANKTGDFFAEPNALVASG
jgi:hypothetical protein